MTRPDEDDPDFSAYVISRTSRMPQAHYNASNNKTCLTFADDIDIETLRYEFFQNQELQSFITAKKWFFSVSTRLRSECSRGGRHKS